MSPHGYVPGISMEFEIATRPTKHLIQLLIEKEILYSYLGI